MASKGQTSLRTDACCGHAGPTRTLWPSDPLARGCARAGWSLCPVPADFPVCSSPGRGCGAGGYKAAGVERRGEPFELRPAGTMREGLGAACEAARPRLCGLLRKILRPQPACGSRRARYCHRPGPPREGGGRLRAGTGLQPDVALTLSERRFPVKIGGLEYPFLQDSDEGSPKVLSPRLGRLRGCNAVATEPREAPRAPASRVEEGWSGSCGCLGTWVLARPFSTGAAAPFRPDIRELEGSCFTKEVRFPELLPDPLPRRLGREEWEQQESQGQVSPFSPQTRLQLWFWV